MMMTANLVGFVIGVDGVRYLGEQLVSSSDGMSGWIPAEILHTMLSELSHAKSQDCTSLCSRACAYLLRCKSCLNIAKQNCGKVYSGAVDPKYTMYCSNVYNVYIYARKEHKKQNIKVVGIIPVHVIATPSHQCILALASSLRVCIPA
jgi:hypothetical protein